MQEENKIIRYGSYLIAALDVGIKNGKKWSYHIIDLNSVVKNNNHRSVSDIQKKTISIIIPISENIKANKVRKISVTNVESFVSKVGEDTETGINGIRFDIVNPESSFVISFITPRRQPEDQPLGFIIDRKIYKNKEIISPGCSSMSNFDNF